MNDTASNGASHVENLREIAETLRERRDFAQAKYLDEAAEALAARNLEEERMDCYQYGTVPAAVAQERAELVKKVDGMAIIPPENDYEVGYNVAMEDVLVMIRAKETTSEDTSYD
jgi:hypothetical protein